LMSPRRCGIRVSPTAERPAGTRVRFPPEHRWGLRRIAGPGGYHHRASLLERAPGIHGSPTRTRTWTACPATPVSRSDSPLRPARVLERPQRRLARRPPRAPRPTAAFSAAQTIATGERAIRNAETAQGGRLVRQSTDGSVNLWSYTSDAAGFAFTDKRVLAGPLADAPAPTVLVDAPGDADGGVA
jgi:hypothetical protein